MENKVYKIYKFTFPNGKCYIGRTIEFEVRLRSHKCLMEKELKRPIYKALRYYGWDNVLKEIIDETDTLDKAIQKELEYILKYDSILNGYNSTYKTEDGGDLWDGLKDTEKYELFVEKMKVINGGKNNGMYGKKHQKTTKQLQKEKAKGRFSLPWYKERYGNELGEIKYRERSEKLKNRSDLIKDSNGRFIKKGTN